MQNLKITVIFEGLDGLVGAIDKLAGAIQAQEAFVIPVGTDAPVAQEQEEPTVTREVKPAKPEPAPSVSAEEVRAKFVDLARAGKRDELKTVLEDFGVENVSALEEDVLGDVYARLEAI